MVAPQHDILTRESRNMMMHLADVKKLIGEEEFAFEKKGYRWRLPIDVGHGFTHPAPGMTKEQKESDREQAEKVYSEVKEWLDNGPLA